MCVFCGFNDLQRCNEMNVILYSTIVPLSSSLTLFFSHENYKSCVDQISWEERNVLYFLVASFAARVLNIYNLYHLEFETDTHN